MLRVRFAALGGRFYVSFRYFVVLYSLFLFLSFSFSFFSFFAFPSGDGSTTSTTFQLVRTDLSENGRAPLSAGWR